MFDTEDEWNAAFEELAAYRSEDQQATAEMMKRRNSIEREHRERGSKLSELERLRQMAIRLCRKAGVKSVTQGSFNDRTKNQLLSIIREAEAVISETERG